MKKPWYKSKVLWFNVAVGVGTAIEASLSVIQGTMDPRFYLAVTGIVAGVNIILRFVSTQGIGK